MIRFFASHPTAANLLMLFFLAIGIVSLPSIKRETFPDFAAKEVEIRVPYPGATSGDVEEAICQRIEESLDAVNDVKEIRCEARENIAIAVAEMDASGTITRFLDDIKTEIEAIDNFPDQVELPVISQLGRTDEVVSLAVTGPMAPTDLKAYAEDIKDELQALPQISQVEIQGFSQRQLRVLVSQSKLMQYGLSISDVAGAIERQSVNLPAGNLETREQDLLLRFDDQRESVASLQALRIVGAASGGEVRLGDLAEITDRFELDEDKIFLDGRRATVLRITKTKAQDTLKVVDEVQRYVENKRNTVPPGVELVLTRNVASIVRDRLQMLSRNGAQGLLLVFLTMWLFFGLRIAFWVAMGLPVAFLGGLFFMSVVGLSINMISMVALLIALGLMMDDAIVISENIATQLEKGKHALRAAVDGVAQVAPGVVSSFLTTVAVFGPLAFLQGDIGKVLKVLPMVLILVLTISLVEAFLILPSHLGHSLAHRGVKPPGRFRRAFDAGLDRVRHGLLGRLVDAAVHQRYLFIGLVIAIFLVSVGMLASGKLKFQAFPDIEGDTLEARILLPQGTPLSRTEAVVKRITDALAKVDDELSANQPGGARLVEHVSVRYNQNADAYESGPHVATVTVDLLTAERRVGSLDEFTARWRATAGDIPDAIAIAFKEPTVGPAGRAIDIRLTGKDLEDLKTAALELQQWLGRYQGVYDLSDDLRPGKPEITLRLKEGALGLGLDAAGIARQLRDAFYGTTASEIQVGVESYEVDVRLTGADKDSLLDLEDFRVSASDGSLVPLSAVAELVPERGWARIQRINSIRTITVQGDVDTRYANANEIVNDTKKRFLPQLLERHPGVRVGLEGQAKESAASGGSMLRNFAMGLLGVFILLSFQFRSYLEPIAVMVAIPLAFIGVIWGHLIMGLELSMPSMMGFVSLSGIVVNDSILLVEFLKLRVREGISVPEAAKRASRERFRAVLITSLTTIAGLLPLLSERSLQAQILIPLATSIVAGLLASTLLVLFVVPALFSIFADLGWTSREKIESEFADPLEEPA